MAPAASPRHVRATLVAAVLVCLATTLAAAAPAWAGGLPVTNLGVQPVTSTPAGVSLGAGSAGQIVASLLPVWGTSSAPVVKAAPQVEAAGASPQLAVKPDTNLTNGEVVTATASGMASNSFGALIECNQANGEPTVQVEGNAVPVGCTNPLNTIESTNSSGGFTAQFTIKTGDIGPPGSGTDSAGNSASADAAKYPCPPTAAQQAAGATCDLSYGDEAGDQVSTPLGFAAAGSPASSTSSSGSSGTSGGSSPDAAVSPGAGNPSTGGGGAAGSSGTASTSGPSGTLPFTGADVHGLATMGLGLVVLGSLCIAASEAARRRKAIGARLSGVRPPC